jgi:hypothetical protein
LMSGASVNELPLAAHTKVLGDEGFGQTHRCNRQPTRFSRASGAAPTGQAPPPSIRSRAARPLSLRG